MGKQERRVVTYVCDRCGFELDGDELAEYEGVNQGPSPDEFLVVGAVKAHNRLMLADPHYRGLTWLCKDCQEAYDLFMAGYRTAAGIRFNTREIARLTYARNGYLEPKLEILRTKADSDL